MPNKGRFRTASALLTGLLGTAVLTRYGLHKRALYAWRRIKSNLRMRQPPPNLSVVSDRIQQIVGQCDARIEVVIQDRVKYLESTNQGDTAPTRVLMPTRAVRSSQVCAYTMPVLTIPPGTIGVAQLPQRVTIGIFLNRNIFGKTQDLVLAIDDVAPGLGPDQMRVEIDIDPTSGVTWSKQIEAWTFCRGSRSAVIQADMVPVPFGTGVVCQDPGPGNDFRSGCTNTQTMLIARQDMDEMWFRKPGFLGLWRDVAVIDQTIWAAFGGRSVRFLWVAD